MKNEEEPKTRYAITHHSKYYDAQIITSNTWVYDTREEAEKALKSIFENNGKATLEVIFGKDCGQSARVDSVSCYHHGQPMEAFVGQ